MKYFTVAWQDSETRIWMSVHKNSFKKEKYWAESEKTFKIPKI